MTPRALALGLLSLLLGCSRGSAVPEESEMSGMGASSGSGGVGGAGAGAGAGASGSAPVAGMENAGAGGGEAAFPPLANDTTSGVFVHLFEWRWPDIAEECERFLGPHGFTAVQISPPSEHAVLASYSFPWWQRYQTVSYALQSRSGTREELVDMVSRCRKAGVGIYVDAVLNHMTAQVSGTGSAGTKYTKYEYPGLFSQPDFHSPVCQIQGSDYVGSAEHVQRCELLSLSDLDTGSATVQQKLAAYLSELLRLGVRGFRLDAAKHVAPPDLQALLAQVQPAHGEVPYYFLEVIDYGGEAVHATDYLDVGGANPVQVTEFKYNKVADAFLGRGGQNLASLQGMSEQSWGVLPSERAVVFINNHDTQRGEALFYQDGAAHDLANVFMLAWPYGYPSVMSSYGFDRGSGVGRDSGPPSDGMGTTQPVYESGSSEPSCVAGPFSPTTKGWICEHRSRHVAGMVGFRKAAGDAPVAGFWTNGANQIAFSRGQRAFVAINHELTELDRTMPTGLPEGTYCDVLSGEKNGTACSGLSVAVDGSGTASLQVPAASAIAIHVAQKL